MIGGISPLSLHARDVAMDEYLDALLQPLAAPTREAVEPAVAAPIEAVPSEQTLDHRAVYRLCRVAGVQLAIPLGDIESHRPLDLALVKEAGAPDWCLGAIQTDGRRCHVIDLARVIAPALADRAAPTVAIALVGGHWILACDALGEEIALASGDVRWRERASDRPWLAGTALERRCAVLDVVGLSGQLSREMSHG
jgi:purine-binding chemotaxis protein CheW